MSIRTCSVLGWLVGSLLFAQSARAYQNPERFAADVALGGGGERYFTGSLLDSYTCGVCHASAERPEIRALGLPEAGYLPDTLYRFVIDWPDDLPRVGMNLELTDMNGQPIGHWILPDDATLTAADRCSLLSDTPTGVSVVELAQRELVTVAECGQQQATLDWLAPSAAELRGDAWLSGSLVSSNHDGELGGDRTGDLGLRLARAGSDAALGLTSDTGPVTRLAAFLQGVDALVCEATLLETDDSPMERGHLTAQEAGRLAATCQTKRLILTHTWDELSPDRLLREAMTAFNGPVELAWPGMEISIS